MKSYPEMKLSGDAALPQHSAVRLCLCVMRIFIFGGCASLDRRHSLQYWEYQFSVRRSLTALCGGKAATRTVSHSRYDLLDARRSYKAFGINIPSRTMLANCQGNAYDFRFFSIA